MDEMALKSVGVVGAGRMGTPIIGHLVRKGFATRACDLDPARAGAVKKLGAQWVASPASLAAECDAILVCVGFDAEVRELLAEGGPLRKARRGAVIAILSTVHPKTVQALAREAETQGLHVVDSTVCRGGEAADSGTLLSFVGGDKETVERLTPVLRAYSSDVVHTGGVGTAQVAKAVNNLILWACLVADHEGLALAQRYGADVGALRRALMLSSCANGPLDKWGTQTMAWADDDMAIVADMAADAGIALPQAEVNREVCRTLKPRRYELDLYGRRT
ncbi:MAG TPA: NAD(P)-dependent oxidoreductase [Burkholderiales bacterium]|nr:NAD(P)-dependent oxidoreductase [Burkholderiales bacterium]